MTVQSKVVESVPIAVTGVDPLGEDVRLKATLDGHLLAAQSGTDADGNANVGDIDNLGRALIRNSHTQLDAFGRLRVSNPEAVFDNKQLYDKGPLWWDEVITDNSGNATSTHSTTDAAVTMHVDADDTIVRQTKTHWNYQPGKSQLVIMTGVLVNSIQPAGITSRIGQFTATDGMFFEWSSSLGLSVVKRKASADTRVLQTDWNHDRLDGTGRSGRAFDPTKEQVFWIAYEWLSGGDLEFGLVVDNEFVLLHEFHHFDELTSPYSSTPNLPIRYEIVSTSGIADLLHICSTVMSEGGKERFGVIRSDSNDITAVSMTSTAIFAVLGIKLKATHLDATVTPISVSLIATTANDAFEWFLALNPTIADGGTPPAFADIANSAVQSAKGVTANTVTVDSWDTTMGGGYGSASTRSGEGLAGDAIHLGSTIAGVVDELWLCARPITAPTSVLAALNWQELS